jgi:hypothetical protein
MSNEKSTTTQEEKEIKIATSADIEKAEAKEKSEEDSYKIVFKKPFVWEDETYTEIDLSGLEDLSAKDMIQTQRVMEKSGSINVLPEMSLEYACIFASKATKMPVEFFQALPPKEAAKLKNRITSFFYGED